MESIEANRPVRRRQAPSSPSSGTACPGLARGQLGTTAASSSELRIRRQIRASVSAGLAVISRPAGRPSNVVVHGVC